MMLEVTNGNEREKVELLVDPGRFVVEPLSCFLVGKIRIWGEK